MLVFLPDGRLGNQIFQYAFLQSYSDGEMVFVLQRFKHLAELFEKESKIIKEVPVSKIPIQKIIAVIIERFIYPLFIKSGLLGYVEQVLEDNVWFPKLIEKKGMLPVKLVNTSFFQSASFFKENALGLKIKDQYLKEAASFLSGLPNGYEYFFVHIRRGDYLKEVYDGIEGIELPYDYYIEGIETIKGVSSCPFFIFLSDDISYVESNFDDVKNKAISRSSLFVDFAIMSLCHGGVASNSSFSWWGGFFSKRKYKIVFPKYWYGWKKQKQSHVEIIPDWGIEIEVSKRS